MKDCGIRLNLVSKSGKSMKDNLFTQDTRVSRAQREKLLGNDSKVLWFTGLSGSGKSTIASLVQEQLYLSGRHCYMLDGDNIRLGLNSDLDFSEEGRKENIRRIAEVAKLFVDSGTITICSFISPFEIDRENAKNIIQEENFIEIYVKCSLDECEKRDVKGLYKKARAGEIPNFTGISSPYEEPKNPNIQIDTTSTSIEECVNHIIIKLEQTFL
jgi:adenylyl-sulfate kinase